MSDLAEREVAIFIEAHRLAGPERAAYLEKVCAGNLALRRKLEELLGMDESAGNFLEKPAQGGSEAAANPDEAAQSSAHPSEKPGDRIGPYKLLQQIGEGGCGVVYMAEQEAPIRRRVALKVIKLGMDTKQVIARFEAERQALALMDHPNIARVLDAGATDTGRPYFVMELVYGIKITEFCDQNSLTTRQRLDLFIQVCQAIQHAHQKGVIHRDIKPSNILVTINDGVPVPKVIDFGIAKATQGRLTDQTLFTAFGQFLGTPAYMSPEQVVMTGLDVDTRSDIYSLGVLLYELLSGSTPFETKELVALGVDAMRKTLSEKEPVRPSTRLAMLTGEELTTTAKRRSCEVPKLIHQLKGDLDWIVMKTLEKDRNRRYETANGLAMDLERHLSNQPVVARPPSRLYEFQKTVRRHKLGFAAAGAVTTALIIGLGLSTWAFLLEHKARNSELAQRRTADEQRQRAEAAARTAQEEQHRADAESARSERFLYMTDMNLVQQAWEQNNMGRLRQLLEDTQESPNRGFEWYYWQRQSHLALKTLRGHLEAVASVAFSPDGRQIVSGGRDNKAIVWDAASGKELFALEGQRAEISCAVFSPDGRRIVTGSFDKTARVWDASSRRRLLTIQVQDAPINAVAFSPDGQRIATCGGDLTARIWDATSGEPLLTLIGHQGEISSLAWSADGQRIVTGSVDNTARVWDAASGLPLRTLKRGHNQWILSVAFSPDGQRIVTGSRDKTAIVWDALTALPVHSLVGHSGSVNAVAFSPDGRRIVTGSDDKTAKIWEVATYLELFTLKGHAAGINSLAFSPDSRQIVTGSDDKTAKVWEADRDGEVLQLKGHSNWISSVAFSPDGQRIVTGSHDRTARVWDSASGRALLVLDRHSDEVRSVAFSPDSQRIVTAGADQKGRVWDAASGRELFALSGHTDGIRSVAFSPDGQRIVTGGDDRTARVWEASTGRPLFRLTGHSGGIASVAFSPDGQRIVTGCWDQTAIVWDAASGNIRLPLKGHTGPVYSVSFSPDSRRIVTSSRDRTAVVWDAASGQPLLTLKGHDGSVLSVAYSPDGKRIITGSGDKTVRVWDAANGRELLTLRAHDAISAVAFSPDGRRIVAGSHEDNTARIWDVATARQVAAWQQEEREANQYLAGREHERAAEQERERIARDRDSIKKWLILAPIALADGQSGADGLNVEQITGESRLGPTEGETVSLAGREMQWRKVLSNDYFIDFNAMLGKVTEHSVAYAVCYIWSEAAQHGLRMLVGSDDEAKVYLNGKQIYQSLLERGLIADQDQTSDITLEAGLNVLVFKVVNETSGWTGALRFTDGEGNPVKGISVTLDPEAKDHL